MDGFHSAAMKANRAEAALRQALALEAQWRSCVSLDMAATVEPSAHGFDAVVRLRNVPPVPDDIVLLLDDFFHHARSALDHVIWQLVIDAGTMPKQQQFPILSVNNTKSSKRLHIDTEGLSPAARQIVEVVQPYHAEHGHRYAHLWRLHRLDVVAKHRSLLPTSSFTGQIGVEMKIEEADVGKYVSHQFPSPQVAEAFEHGFVLRTHNVAEDFQPPDPATWLFPSPPALWIAQVDDCEPIALAKLPNVLDHVRHIVFKLSETRDAPVVGVP
jgi:hypothetical protein